MFEPNIVETIGRSTKIIDIPTKLLQERILFLGDEIDDEIANNLIISLLWLKHVDESKDVDLYINSPGGVCTSTYAIKDVIYQMPYKVNTIGLGECASGGAYLLACGTGTRRVTENCRIMVHGVQSGAYGSMPDMRIQMKESEHINSVYENGLVQFSKGKINQAKAKELMARDTYMDGFEAIELGLIDSVI